MGLGFTAVKMGSRVLVLNHGTELLLQAEGKKNIIAIDSSITGEAGYGGVPQPCALPFGK